MTTEFENSGDPLEKMMVTPEHARNYLEFLGYTEDVWDEMMEKRFGSHNVRAYITIARGGGSKIRRRGLSGRTLERWFISYKKFIRN
ncbi:MAG: hypothetical protein Q8Q91_03065 [Candidatus Daviesbacteria bacterium]|nr:hypothetical protein [Candidatus Daviesbacteria bacterium]